MAVIYKYKRAIGFNGIALTANRADLLDRAFIVEIEAVTDEIRRELDGDILIEFDKLRPQLFGFMLDILVKLLRMKEEGGIKLKAKSRMADFEVHCEMIARCLGYPDMAFVDVYRKNKKLGTNEILENNSVALALREFMRSRKHWRGYSSLLLHELVSVATTTLKMETHKDKHWPKSPSFLSRRLKELKNSLIEYGIQVFWIDDPVLNRRALDIVNMQPVQPVQPVNSESSTNKTDCTGGTSGTGGTLQGFSGGPPNGANYERKGLTNMFVCKECGLCTVQYAMERHVCVAWQEQKQKQQKFQES